MNTSAYLKCIKLVLTTGFLGLVLTTSAANSPSIDKEDSSYVNIHGSIGIKDKTVKGNYKVEVMEFGSVVTTFSVKKGSSINLLLKKNASYVLRISKKGFIPRLICLNTKIHGAKNTGAFTFRFDADFIAQDEARTLNSEALELPVGLIAYDKTTGDFNNNHAYSSFVDQSIYASLR